MKVSRLIEILKNMREDLDVRIASQPKYPMEYSVDSVAETDKAIYLVEEEQIGGLPREVRDEVGW